MSSTDHIDHDDLALFAMQLLSAQEEAAILEHLKGCPECVAALAELQGDLAIYATTTDMHSPPALNRERLLAQVAREPKARPVEPNETAAVSRQESSGLRTAPTETPSAPIPIRRRESPYTEVLPPAQTTFGRFAPWIGWAVAAGLAVLAGNFYHESQAMRSTMADEHAQLQRLTQDAAAARSLMETLKDPSATRVTLTKPKAPPAPQGKVTYVADRGTLLFVASNMEPLQTYKVYELWLIPADGRDPLPAGTFHPDAKGNASIVLPKLPPGTAAKAFGITIEDEGGSQTPTMPIVMAGAAAGA